MLKFNLTNLLGLFLATCLSVATAFGQGSGADSSKKRGAPKSDDNSLFQNKRKSWSIGLQGGYPYIKGDVAADFGYIGGLTIRKAIGHSFSLRAVGYYGQATGQGWKRASPAAFRRHDGLNGVNNPAANYFAAGLPVYYNYQTQLIQGSFQVLYNLNNINFLRENTRSSLYLFGGGGAVAYNSYTDALDANNQLYAYNNIAVADEYKERKATRKAAKALRDGTYETRGDGNKTDAKLSDRTFSPTLNAGLGYQYKLSERLSLNLEGEYAFTGDDLLDGQRWYNADYITAQPDALLNLMLGINLRLGRTENVYWYTNPLQSPYQTIQESKRKLKKVDDLEKDVQALNGRVDTLDSRVDSLMADADNDGVADFRDLEDGTPSGSIVNGQGQTTFYTDDQGNLVYNDPSASAKGEYTDAEGNTKNYYNNGNNPNGDGTNGNGNNNGNNGNGSTGPKTTRYNQNGQPVQEFDKANPAGKTVVARKGGATDQNAPGSKTAIGYLPAVFFETNNSTVTQRYFPELFTVANLLRSSPNTKVYVIGYADKRSTESYNRALGMRRAQAVANSLINNFGVSSSQLMVESRGELEPLTNASSVMGLAANRRVQFSLTPLAGNSGSGSGSGSSGTRKAPVTTPTSDTRINNIATPTPPPTQMEAAPVQMEKPQPANSNETITPANDGLETLPTTPPPTTPPPTPPAGSDDF